MKESPFYSESYFRDSDNSALVMAIFLDRVIFSSKSSKLTSRDFSTLYKVKNRRKSPLSDIMS